MINRLKLPLNLWRATGPGLFLLALGGVGLIATAFSLPASTFMTVTGVILMALTFFLSQNIIRPHHAVTSGAEMPCPACNDVHRPGVLFCQVCGRELTPSSVISVSSPSSFWGSELSPLYLVIVIVILLLFLSLIFGWA